MSNDIASGQSFFRRFKNRLWDSHGSDPGGRYFAILLEQLFYEDKTVLREALFPTLKLSELIESRVSTEFPLPNGRRADLAVHNRDDQLIALAEVKENDQLAAGVDEQTMAYLKYISNARKNRQPIVFAYVTKHLPSRQSLEQLERYCSKPVFYRDIYSRLQSIFGRPHATIKSMHFPVAQLLCRYLEEEGVIYRQLENERPITFLLRQSATGGSAGLGKLHTAETVADVPKSLELLIANAEAIGIEFYDQFRAHFGNRFVPSLKVTPQFNDEALFKAIKKRPDSDEIDIYKYSEGSYAWIWSHGRLAKVKPPHWAYVALGYSFELDAKASNGLGQFLFAEISTGGRDFYLEKPYTKFPNQTSAQIRLRRLLKDVLGEALGSEGAPKQYHKALTMLDKQLSAHD